MGPLDPPEDDAAAENPWIDYDLSALSYPDFIRFFFDRPIVGSTEKTFELFSAKQFGANGYWSTDPANIVANVRTMCSDFVELTKMYSHDQLDQGLWALFGSTGIFPDKLFDPAIDLQLRFDCVEAMYKPFRDVVAHHAGDIHETFYFMWWDMILHGLHPMPREYRLGYVTLTPDQQRMIDAIVHTLAKVLALDHRGCQFCALHGFGHLYHPLADILVQTYLDQHRTELSADDAKWIEACLQNHIQ